MNYDEESYRPPVKCEDCVYFLKHRCVFKGRDESCVNERKSVYAGHCGVEGIYFKKRWFWDKFRELLNDF